MNIPRPAGSSKPAGVTGPGVSDEDARLAVEAAIPHRAPFLFVDRILASDATTLSAQWTVPVDADFFRGHFPGEPVTPGVILSEHTFQVAAILCSQNLGGMGPEHGVPALAKIENARFKQVVAPGDKLETRVKLRERIGPGWYFSGRVERAGKLVLAIRFVLTAIERPGA